MNYLKLDKLERKRFEIKAKKFNQDSSFLELKKKINADREKKKKKVSKIVNFVSSVFRLIFNILYAVFYEFYFFISILFKKRY
jgi:DNA polymerase elongation subunit (family B)